MDETLICFIDNSVWDGLSLKEQKDYEHTYVLDGVCVFRPYLKAFLDGLFSITDDVYIWTRGTRPYAINILDEIRKKTGHTFKHLFSREHCEEAFTIQGYDKDLEYLWALPNFHFTKRNTILIDDLKSNTQNPSNRRNSIQVLQFKISPLIDLHDDDTLLQTLNILQKLQKTYKMDVGENISYPFALKRHCVNCN